MTTRTFLRSPFLHAFEFCGVAETARLSGEMGDGRPSLTIVRRGTHFHHARNRVVVADPGSAVLYRGDAPFRLSHPFIGPKPDLSLVIEFGQDTLEELFGPRPLDRDLGLRLAPATMLAAALAGAESGDALEGEEELIGLLALAARDLGIARAERAVGRTAHRRVERAREVLATDPNGEHDLTSLARATSCSPFHLSRLFHRATGLTLRSFRLHLRLAAALDGLAEGEDDLTDLALRCGFADHAHMTNAVRRAFGATPSALREQLGVHGLREKRNSVQARTRGQG